VLAPGLERACLRSLLGVRCLSAAAADIDHARRVMEDVDGLIGMEVVLKRRLSA
jgi:hypothetical protein